MLEWIVKLGEPLIYAIIGFFFCMWYAIKRYFDKK